MVDKINKDMKSVNQKEGIVIFDSEKKARLFYMEGNYPMRSAGMRFFFSLFDETLPN